jgi:hypothetical protein
MITNIEAEDWYFRLINDSDTFAKLRYLDAIDDYNTIIQESEKLLEITPLQEHT